MPKEPTVPDPTVTTGQQPATEAWVVHDGPDIHRSGGDCGICASVAAIEAEAAETARRSAAERVTVERLAFAFIRVRGAHNPVSDELILDQEVRPCAWCRLAAEQAIEAIAAILEPDHA